jgi:hypothetical protein
MASPIGHQTMNPTTMMAIQKGCQPGLGKDWA